MLRIRVIPCLQLIGESLVKAVKFGKFGYIGDPINTVRIFNELEVDELCFLDIRATVEKRPPNFKVLREIANECFMPLAYGGGVRDLATAKQILEVGFEKIVVNTVAYEDASLIRSLAQEIGSQSLVVSMDVKRNFWGTPHLYSHDGTRRQQGTPVEWAQQLESYGAGELLVTSMDREGTWGGYDIELLKSITDAVNVPVIANGGAGTVAHLGEAIEKAGVSAVGVGSMVVYQRKDLGVLVNYPNKAALDEVMTTTNRGVQ